MTEDKDFADGVPPLVQLAAECPDLTLVVLSPLHFVLRLLKAILEQAPHALSTVRVVCMGGGFDDGRIGYNWGVHPQNAAVLLALAPSLGQLRVVCSEVVRKSQVGGWVCVCVCMRNVIDSCLLLGCTIPIPMHRFGSTTRTTRS